MNLESCYKVGEIIKAYGVKGEVIAEFAIDDPDEYENLESVFVEINQKLVPFFINEISVTQKRAIIKFEDVDSIEDTKLVVNRSLYLMLDEEDSGEELEYEYLTGFKIKDKQLGELGAVKQYIERPGQDLIVMEYRGKEVYIPIDKNIILKVDAKKKTLLVDLPDGIIDVN